MGLWWSGEIAILLSRSPGSVLWFELCLSLISSVKLWLVERSVSNELSPELGTWGQSKRLWMYLYIYKTSHMVAKSPASDKVQL